MGGFPPVYPDKDIDKLDEKQRNKLRLAIFKVLQTDKEIRKLLKDRTEPVYRQLIKKSKKK